MSSLAPAGMHLVVLVSSLVCIALVVGVLPICRLLLLLLYYDRYIGSLNKVLHEVMFLLEGSHST